MDNIDEPKPKLSYDELLQENTQLKNQVQELQKASKKVEGKYQNIIESSPLGVLLYTLEDEDRLIFKGYNKSAETILGVELESLIGKTIEDAFPPLAETEIPFEYKKTAKTGEEFFTNQVDYDFDKIKGAYEVRAYQVSKNNIAINFSDIAERLEKEVKLKESQQKFKSLFDNIEEGVALHKMIFDEDNNPIDFVWVDVNPTYEKLTHLKKENLIGNKGKDVIPNIEKKWYDIYTEVVLTGIPKTVTDHSEYLDKYWEVRVFRPQEGHFAVAMTDVTEKVISEERIQKSESVQRKMVANIGDVIVIIDKNEINRYKSPNVKNQFGWEVDELVGKSAFSKVHPDHIEGAKELLSDLVHDPKKTITTELRYIRKDGEYRWIEMTISNLLYDPEIDGFLGNYHDITERKLDEEALHSSQEMLLTSQSLANICSYSTNLIVTEIDKSHWECSPEFYKIFGIDETYPHTIEGWIGFLHPDYREDVAAYHESVVLEKKSFNLEYKIIRINDGVERWVHGTGELVYDENGNPIRMHGAIQDITERKKTEAQLITKNEEYKKAKEKAEGSEKILKTTLQTAMDGYWVVDIKGRFINVNDTYCNISGYSREDLLSMQISDVEAKQSPEEVNKNIQRIKQLGQLRFETKHVRKDGTLYDVELGVQYQEINDGQFVCFIKDVTSQKKHEKELIDAKVVAEQNELKIKLNEQRLNALVELSQMTDKSDDYIYDFTLNKAIELTQSKIGFLGFVNDDESEVDIYKWSDSAMKECAVRNINMNFIVDEAGVWGDVVRQRKPVVLNDYSQPIPNKNGIPVGHVNIKNYLSIPTFQQNKIIAIISVANKGYDYSQTDINQLTLLLDGMRRFLDQRKEKEELINAKEKAEESDRLKSAFLANMSHEIRTPMNGILGFTSLLQDANLSIESQKGYVDIIRKSGDRLLNTVNDIIEISKIESGDISVTKSEVDIIGHLDTLVTFFRPEAEKKNIDIIVQNSIDGNDLTITTDKNKLSSILSNLIKNAIKYTNEGTINVGLKVENNQILFTCQDTGIGIPKSRQEAIFNRFEQADIEDKHALQGSGLGLAIVKSYVEILNGKIWVESEVGQGSTFNVSLPFEHEKKEEQIITQKVKSSDSGIKNINVLIVEDDEYSSMHLSVLMKNKVENISTAVNGIEAIDACNNDSGIDLILMDIQMPVMGGLEATKKIRKFNKDVIIIAQTAYALSGDKEKALDAGCNDYISKPIKKDKLFELINKYF